MSLPNHVPPPDLRCEQAVVRVQAGRNRYHDGVLSEVSGGVIVVDFPLAGTPNLWIGQEVQMNVTGPRLGSSVQAVGRVSVRVDDGARCRYRFESGPEDLGALQLLVERRGLQRVAPLEELWVRICSSEGHSLAVGRVLDVSRAGLRALVDGTEAQGVTELAHGLLVLQLPREDDVLQLHAQVRSAGWVPEAGGLGLGFEFLAGPATAFLAALERLDRFVADCVIQHFQELSNQVRRR